jgi:hypothetical protein
VQQQRRQHGRDVAADRREQIEAQRREAAEQQRRDPQRREAHDLLDEPHRHLGQPGDRGAQRARRLALGHRVADAQHQREDDQPEHVAGSGRRHRVGRDHLHHAAEPGPLGDLDVGPLQVAGLRHQLGAVPGAGRDRVDHQEAEADRDRRQDRGVRQRPHADPAQRLGVELGDAGDQRGEDQRHREHEHQPQEHLPERQRDPPDDPLHVGGAQHAGADQAAGGEAERAAGEHADQDRVVRLGCGGGRAGGVVDGHAPS